jgi:hypothetical protein
MKRQSVVSICYTIFALALISTPSFAQQKTVRACQEEWRANRSANQAAGITERAFVEKCRAGSTTAQPAPAPAPNQSRPAARTTVPPAGAPARTAAPASRTAPTTGAGTSVGAGQYAVEAQAKARCPNDTVVWVNPQSKIYHYAGYKPYGTTKSGAYMCERDSTAAGFRAAKNEKHPQK